MGCTRATADSGIIKLNMEFVGRDERKYEIAITEEVVPREKKLNEGEPTDVFYYYPIIATIRFQGKEIGSIVIQEKWEGDTWQGELQYGIGCDCFNVGNWSPNITEKPLGPNGCGCIHGWIDEKHRRNGIGTFVIEQFKKTGYDPCPDTACSAFGDGWIEFWKDRGLKEINGTPIEQLVPSY